MQTLNHLPTHQVFDFDPPKLLFTEEVSHFDNSEYGSFYNRSLISPGYKKSNDAIDIISEGKKAIMFLPEPFFHYFADLVGSILYIIENEPGCEIIIDETVMNNNLAFKKRPNYYSFVYEMMDNLGIRYRILSDTNTSTVNINNFILIDAYSSSYYSAISKRVLEYVEKYVIKDFSEPFRKVYLSRSSSDAKIKQRVDDETKLTNFFIEKGFEVVDVDSFKNIEDQIRFFHQAKIVCGLTGSGLTNMLFTKNDQIAIELVTLLGVPTPLEDNSTLWHFHNFYKAISFGKNQTLINIPNYGQNSKSLVELISKHLKVLGEL